MAIATDRPIQQKALSFDEFLVCYCDDNRYELIDGDIFEPTGLHEEVAAFITTKVCVQIDQMGLPWFVLQRGLIRPDNMGMTAFRPDVAVIDQHELTKEPIWSEQSILTLGSSIKFVAEVVSSNWQNDYARKVEDYATLGIPEYWIADYAGLGGVRHIGKSKQPTLSICTLVNGEYEIQQLRGNQIVVSTTFPNLKLTAAEILKTF
ncbi:Uma2 family endonuclease [Dolichospermum sp. ST_con]|nr:Uma2 family endonuclease [Dolichospermum sp. ST_con]MDD1419203.1 Uma2 family endonuclease [Dolichospermum sp. ST_sed1]MDD1425318.1 Uma2 family endonuclease [Dolichospermum sp. ST_sed9]MDD1431550.1 Uma2 family endonuclease [Dolichospermum sp. ST_sed6]MDD1437437.1 Uma2 family endonuclease [Dolichospermum sp. ST_sed10]MDD1441003.1 Uma2 family endonuclease [Dolichospermum sp. ST_sed3]MDD1446054.1 Uma2 family endonuclease [Dolichospermum sp. ST_sed8]MDD1455033.1 Uma2 family endonuclease [Dolic